MRRAGKNRPRCRKRDQRDSLYYTGSIDKNNFASLSHFHFLFQAYEQVITDAQHIRNGGQRRIQCTDAWEKTRVHDVKIVEFVRLAIHIQHRIFRVSAKAAGAGLMADARNGDVFAEIKIIRDQVRVQVEMLQQRL